jgi:hypothetical protein
VISGNSPGCVGIAVFSAKRTDRFERFTIFKPPALPEVYDYPTVQKRSQLPFNKIRNRAIPFPLQGQKRLQMFRDDSIKWVIFRIPRMVPGFSIANEETFIQG